MNQIEEMVNKLINMTKNKAVEWSYLDCNSFLCNRLQVTPDIEVRKKSIMEKTGKVLSGETDFFESSNSFYIKIKENYVVVYTVYNLSETDTILADKLELLLVPSTFRDIKICTVKDCQLLQRLYLLIKSSFPNPNDIINDILNMED